MLGAADFYIPKGGATFWAVYLVFGILSVVGLLLITFADLDLNKYLQHNQLHLVAFVVVMNASNIIDIFTDESDDMGQVFWLQVVPFVALVGAGLSTPPSSSPFLSSGLGLVKVLPI